MKKKNVRLFILFAVLAAAGLPNVACSAPQAVSENANKSAANANTDKTVVTTAGNLVRLDPRFDKLVPADAKLEKIADGFNWVEGPVWNRKENYLLFSDIPANSIFKWQQGKTAELFLKPSGYTGAAPFEGREPGSNGLTFDANGNLILCEHGDRRVTRLEANGKKTTLADKFEGKRFNSPNDLVFKSNGDLYFTDPPFGLPKTFEDPQRELDFCGVYRLSKDGKVTLLATKEVKAPNGIAFSPDEKTLYITDVDANHFVWMAYDVKDDGTLANGRLFYDAGTFAKTKKGAPDGLKVDKDGNLFASGPEGIYVFAPDATLLGIIATGERTSNCNWGEDGSALFVTADKAVLRIKLNTKGKGF
jgi:gluconolactonase